MVTSQIVAACGCVSGAMHFTKQQLQLTEYTICGNQTADDGEFPTSPTRSVCLFYSEFGASEVSLKRQQWA